MYRCEYFLCEGGRVATPPATAGCLQGITRSVLLEIGASVGAPVEERTLRPEDLYAADEVFISSTNRSMLGVSELPARSPPPWAGYVEIG